ncbi:MAG: hypothetical protein ACRD5Z_03245 [Bryobacteraceae bacterium]
MRTAPLITPPPTKDGSPASVPPPPAVSATQSIPMIPQSVDMDREFILRNQIAERYIAGRLPIRGTHDFERYCRQHPEFIQELGMAERVHSALRLLEAGGVALPWEAKARAWWEGLPALIAVAVLAIAAGITAMVLASKISGRDSTIGTLRHQVAEQPLEPATSTRTMRLIPSRTAPSGRPAIVLGGGGAQMADLKIDMSWSKFTAFRVTIDRQGQGRVAVVNYMLRDSNGDLRLSLNTTALGPGAYQFAIEALTLHSDAVAQAWVTVGIVH